MRHYPILLSLFVGTFFFILGSSTSQDIDFPVPFQLNLAVDTLGTNIVLTNSDTLNISSASLFLNQPLDSINTKRFTLSNYSLNMGITDTIPMDLFVNNMETYPIDTVPSFFQVEALNASGGLVQFLHEF